MTTAAKITKLMLQSVLLLSCAIAASHAAEMMNVQLVLSNGNAPYQNFAQTFRQNLPERIKITILQRAEDFSEKTPIADLLVTVGTKAANWVATRTTSPMLAAMIPSNTYVDLLKQRPHASQTSAIYLDQPWNRQLDLLQAALPARSKIGVLHSADSHLNIPVLRAELSHHGLTLFAGTLQNEASLFADLEEVLTNSEVLLAVPDSAIFSNSNIRNILLSSYRHGIPLIGLSQSYVRAGALCAIYSTPEHLAAQASTSTLSFMRTRHLPAAQYPVLYSIAVNLAVARTMGINIQSAELLQLQVEKSPGALR